MKKRILSMLLVFVMLLSILPVGAFAANITNERFTITVNLAYPDGSIVASKTLTLNCADKTGHSGYNHSTKLNNFSLSNCGWSSYSDQISGWQLHRYSYFGSSTSSSGTGTYLNSSTKPLIHYNITGSEPYRADESFWWILKAPTTYNYAINYDTQGGSYVAPTTTSSTATSVTLNVTSTIPTKAGYTFLGWAESAGATSPNAQSKYTLTSSNPTKTLYAVWEAIPTVNWDGLTITKTVDKTTVAPGDEVTYTIQVNNGIALTDLKEVKVSDVLDKNNLEFVSASATIGTYNSATGVWNIGSLYNPYTATLTIKAKVKDTVPDGTQISNTATITSAQTGDNQSVPSGKSSTATITVKVPEKKLSEFSKELVTDETVLPDDFDTDNLINVTIPEDGATSVNAPGGSVTLLYKLTVEGEAGANFVITDENVTKVYPATVTQDDETGLISGTIPADGKIDIYVIKEFSGVTQGQELYNTASIAPGDGTRFEDCIDEEVDSDRIMALVPPGTSEVTSILYDEELVTVDCTNTYFSHEDEKYPLLDGSYTIGDVEEVNTDDSAVYTCDITIHPEKYVAKYNEKYSGHTLDPDGQKGIITLSWNGRSWAPVAAARSTAVPQVLFTVKCETPEPQEYPVKYHIVGQSELAHQDTITSETVATYQFWKPNEVEGYTFDGWYEKEKDIGISGKEAKLPLGLKKYELYGKYVANQYTVHFDANCGTGSMDDQEFTYDVAQNLTPNDFTYEHYRFAGWNTQPDGTGTSYFDEQNVKNLTAVDDGTVTLYAQWTQLYPVYLVIYRNGDTTTPYKSKYIDELAIDDTLKINFDIADYYDGATEYEFDGWYDSYTADGPGNKLGESITIGGETRIYCMVTDYEKVVVMTVTNGDKDNAETIYTGTTLHGTNLIDYLNEKVTVPAKTGYTVDKWFNWDSYDNKFADDTIVNGWTNVYVTYTANQYKVHFDANGGEGEMEDQSYVYDEEKELTPNSFTREGYTFGGWNTEADGTGVAYADMESVKNLTAEDDGEVTLYAVWDVRTDLSYTVNYIEKYTNKQLHDPKIVTGQTFGTEVTENAIDIPGYYKINPTSATITIAVSGNEITFYYMRKYVPPVNPDVPGKPELDKENHVAYVIGYPDGTVRPQNNITRAEVATIFFRLMTEDSRNTYMAKIGQNASFTDVEEGAWYYNAVYTLAEAGILGGYPDGSFKPNEPITRAEFAAVVARFYEDAATGKCEFSDVPAAHWANECIALAEGKGLINGYPDGTFRPEQPINRAETMTLINRVLERAVKEEDMLEDMITWSDNLPGAWYYEAVQEATNSHEYVRTEEKVDQNGIKQEYCYEDWTMIEDVPDWAALEKSWAEKNAQ